uniref:LeoA/HP0731 family dynamin-like GTPase n=1 Tax=Segatella copri TaxID=165179 RepID=UPI003FF13519
MEEFNIKNNKLQKLTALKQLLQKGVEYIPELQSYLGKIDSIVNTIKDGEISVVLLGSFSDGKTSAIAGLLGRLEDNMKIDNDESSDELTIYRPKDLKKGFKIIDTPGLFGTKEREINGQNIKFSEITERYISEAHIIIYVCDAVVPLKDSHVEIIRRIMRDYHKLDNTIFVINKMDEAGYDLLDEYDFNNGCKIKKENLISRLRSTINLTPDEEKRLHVVCIAADPKGKGLQHWFSKIDNYYERSHIKDLRKCVNAVVNNADTDKLSSSSYETSVSEIVDGLHKAIECTEKPVSKAIVKMERDCTEIEEDGKHLKSELTLSRNELRQAINEIKNDAIREINGASLETIGDIISAQLGVQNNQVTFYVFQDKLSAQIEQCCEANANNVNLAAVKIEKAYSMQDAMLNDAVKYGVDQLKNLNITGEQIKAVRDVIAKGYKFKPWGAINMGKNITKWAGWIGAGIGTAFELYGWYKQYKDQKKLNELKKSLTNAINDCISNVFKTFESDNEYYKNFAPSYILLCQKIQERNEEIASLKQKVQYLENYKRDIEAWKNSAEYVDFEEV